jgi:tight adherence protein B
MATESKSASAIGAAIDRYRNKLQQQLNTASINISPINWMAMQVGITVVGFVLLGQRLQNPIVGLIVSALISFFGTRFVVNSRTEKRIADFEANLPQTLQLLASGIRSGLTFDQAIESSSTQDRSEVGRQFRLAVAEAQLDNELEAALLRVSKRMKSDDLKWLVSALQIQREIGGSLSSILDTVADTIRARADIRREVRVLSAEGKLSGYVLIAMPFLVLVALMVIRPTYVAFFWSSPLGITMAVGFLTLVGVGWFWLQKIVKVKA